MNLGSHSADAKTKILYVCAAVLLAVFFILILFRPVSSIFHEQDLWWMIPTLSHIAGHNSFLETVKIHLFDPYPTNRGEPSMNLYLFFILAAFGFQAKYFILASILLHIFCAILLYFLVRGIGFDLHIAFLSAFAFAATFIHFSYYMFPMAAQHLVAMFFALLVLNLYLKTVSRIDEGGEWRNYFRLTLFFNLLASFCQIAILILPASVLSHILICSKDAKDRVRKYDIWLPLFITYFGYPLIRSFYYGYPHLEYYLRWQNMNIYSPALFPLIFAAAVGSLFLFRLILVICKKFNAGKAFRNLFIGGSTLYLLIFLAAYGRKEWLSPLHRNQISLSDFLSPFNLIRPFYAAFAGFLQPFKSALSIDSAKAYYYIPIKSEFVFLALSILFIFVFLRKYFVKNKAVVILFVFYLFALRAMTEIFLWNMKASIPSRYFIYATPLASVMFSSAFVYLYFLFMDKTALKRRAKEIILILIFIGLCIPNILAVRLEILRGRLANTLFIYDYIRTSHLVKQDLAVCGELKRVSPSDLYINGIVPVPFFELGLDFSPVDPLKLDTFRYTLAQVFADRRFFEANLNKIPPSGKVFVYSVDGPRLNDAAGRNVDRFSAELDNAKRELASGQNSRALALFRQAANKRPFLLNYILASYKIEDLRWITGQRNLRMWLNDMISCYDGCSICPLEKLAKISEILDNEVNDYLRCAFYISYLSHLENKEDESEYWLSRMSLLDTNENVFKLLREDGMVNSDRRMAEFLKRIETGQVGVITQKSSLADFVLGLILNKDTLKQDG
ncbi:MAG: hypothetical protein V1933_07155 [Candidatus Omnitrophota bacterium]